MTRETNHSDIWVIHQEHALLFRQQDQMWHEESRHSFTDFLGSAAALSSFSIPDTRVYLNLEMNAAKTDALSSWLWVGIQESPLRLQKVSIHQTHLNQLKDLRSMGKKATIIATQSPEKFEHATRMQQMNTREIEHLEQWVQEQKKDMGSRVSTAVLLVRLWTKPLASYQKLRMTVAASCVLTALVLQWNHSQQSGNHEDQTLRHIQQTLKASQQQTADIPFEQWAIQINKFGKGDRANLNALSMHWNASGQIHTFTRLDRDRKRAPKGCELSTPTQAVCLTSKATP